MGLSFQLNFPDDCGIQCFHQQCSVFNKATDCSCNIPYNLPLHASPIPSCHGMQHTVLDQSGILTFCFRFSQVLQMLHLHLCLYTYVYFFLTQSFSSFKLFQRSTLCLNTASLFHAVHDPFILTHWLNLFPIYRHSLLISALLPFHGYAHPLSLTQSDSH